MHTRYAIKQVSQSTATTEGQIVRLQYCDRCRQAIGIASQRIGGDNNRRQFWHSTSWFGCCLCIDNRMQQCQCDSHCQRIGLAIHVIPCEIVVINDDTLASCRHVFPKKRNDITYQSEKQKKPGSASRPILMCCLWRLCH